LTNYLKQFKLEYMTYKQFEDLLLTYKQLAGDISDLYDIGVDLMEGKYEISKNVEKMFEISIESVYGDDGLSWVTWFIWENEWGEKDWGIDQTNGNGAFDSDGNPMANSIQSLYELLENQSLYELIEKDHKIGSLTSTTETQIAQN